MADKKDGESDAGDGNRENLSCQGLPSRYNNWHIVWETLGVAWPNGLHVFAEPRENRMKPKTETEEKARKKSPYEPPTLEKREQLEEVVEAPLPPISGQE